MLKVEIPAGYLHDFCLFESKPTTSCRPSRNIQKHDLTSIDTMPATIKATPATMTTTTTISSSSSTNASSIVPPTKSNSNSNVTAAAAAAISSAISAHSPCVSFEELTISNWSDCSSTATAHEIWTDFIPDFEVPDLCSFDTQELQRREAALLSQVDWDMYDEISPYSSTECINASTESSSDDEMDSPIMTEHFAKSTSLSDYSCASVSMSVISCSGLSTPPIEMTNNTHTSTISSPEASPMEIPVPSTAITPSPSIEASLKRTRSSIMKRTPSFSTSTSDDEDQSEQSMDYEEEEEEEEEEDADEDEEEEEVKPRRTRKRQAKMLTPPSTGSEEDSPVSSPSSGGVRKVSHNEMERKRRGELRMEFQRLRAQLPKLASEKAPKITILNEANIYLDSLHSKISTNKSSMAKLLKERDNLRRQLEQVRGR